jgi:uncharacterized protein (TIGR00296 family)
MNLPEGQFAVKLARKAMESFVNMHQELEPSDYPKEFSKPHGVFTTIYNYPIRGLRGCIGYPYPELPLSEAIIHSAIQATRDPRFLPLGKEELRTVVIEVSILTEPKLIQTKNPNDYPKYVKIGKDGLIIKFGFSGGLLLPQVPTEYGWDAKTFLQNLCYKAGLSGDAWKSGQAEIYKFQTEIFAEESPNGEIKRL